MLSILAPRGPADVRLALRLEGCSAVADARSPRRASPPKLPPADATRAALDGVEKALEELYPGDMAAGVNQGLSGDPKAVEKALARYLPA
jgi:hypothetical protein